MPRLTKKQLDFISRRTVCMKVIRSQFPTGWHGDLHCAVIDQAVKDANIDLSGVNNYVNKNRKISILDRRRARLYLSGKMWNAEICGVSSEWVRKKLIQYRLFDEPSD